MKSIIIEGELVTYETSGGFGPDDITIAGESLSVILAKFFGQPLDGRGERVDLGRVRITIERLDEADPDRSWPRQFRIRDEDNHGHDYCEFYCSEACARRVGWSDRDIADSEPMDPNWTEPYCEGCEGALPGVPEIDHPC